MSFFVVVVSFIEIKCAKDKWVKSARETNSRAIPWKCYKKKAHKKIKRVTINTTNINQKVETNTQDTTKKININSNILLISKSFLFLILVAANKHTAKKLTKLVF